MDKNLIGGYSFRITREENHHKGYFLIIPKIEYSYDRKIELQAYKLQESNICIGIVCGYPK